MQHSKERKIRIGLVDDHQLFSKSLSLLISGFTNFEILVEASNGIDLQEKISRLATLPDIMLVDVSMPRMDGPQTAVWLKKNYPDMRLIALSMNDREQTIITMLKSGCSAYLFKDIHPAELERALNEVYNKGFYNADLHNRNIAALIKSSQDDTPDFSDREIEFLRLSCLDLTYQEIANQMRLSLRTIDGYREVLFKKLGAQSRTSMVLEGLRKGLISLD